MTQPVVPSSTSPRPITQLRECKLSVVTDVLATEEPLEIRINDQPVAITLRTPGHDADLAAGFCLTEGIVDTADELEDVQPCSEADKGNVMLVTLTAEALMRRQAAVERAKRQTYLSSSCGLCGKESLDRIAQDIRPIEGRFTLSREVLMALPEVMRGAQATFDKTGGLHAAGLFTPAGRLRTLREDVGRHNAVDKAIGQMLLTGQIPADDHVLLVSGRASFEIMQKAARAGIGVVAAISAPSSLAVDFAIRFSMTLVGFLRPGRMNIYHDVDRLIA